MKQTKSDVQCIESAARVQSIHIQCLQHEGGGAAQREQVDDAALRGDS